MCKGKRQASCSMVQQNLRTGSLRVWIIWGMMRDRDSALEIVGNEWVERLDN